MPLDAVAVRRATVADYMAFFHGELPSWVATHEGQAVAIGGFVQRSGRCWAYLNVRPGQSVGAGITVLRAVTRHLKAVKGAVYVTCDVFEYPGAERLLAHLGFVQTDEVDNNMKVWAHVGH